MPKTTHIALAAGLTLSSVYAKAADWSFPFGFSVSTVNCAIVMNSLGSEEPDCSIRYTDSGRFLVEDFYRREQYRVLHPEMPVFRAPVSDFAFVG